MWLIDRDIGLTLKRAYRSVGFWDRLSIIGGLGTSVLSSEEIGEEDIEKLKRGDMLESAFSEFARESAPLYRSLIAERDSFMAARLREESAARPLRRVLAVVGAGHLAGLERELAQQQEAPPALRTELERVPPAPSWPKWLAIALFVLIGAAIGLLFHRDLGHGTDALRDWVLFTGGFALLGTVLGGGHPQRAGRLCDRAAQALSPRRPHRRRRGGRGDVAAQAACRRFRQPAPRRGRVDRMVEEPRLAHPAGVPAGQPRHHSRRVHRRFPHPQEPILTGTPEDSR